MNSNIAIGALLFVGGSVITMASYSSASGGGSYTVFYGAILVGAVQMIVGFMQGGSESEPATNYITEEEVDKAGISVILRSMISMAAADGRLDESEVTMIRVVTKLVFGQELAEQKIRDMSAQMIAENSDITAELMSLQQIVTWEDADLAVVGMAMVAMSDGDMDALETARLEDYAGALGVDQDRFDASLEKARANVVKLTAPVEEEASAPPAGAAAAT